jgi:anti-anti-sigma factor
LPLLRYGGLSNGPGNRHTGDHRHISAPIAFPPHAAPRRYSMAAINIEPKDEVLVIYFTDGKILDSQRIEQVGRELQEAVPQAIHKKLVLNFRGVSFMSSAMITKLVMLNKSCKTQGVSLKFCDLSTNVMEVFKITKLNKLFDIHKSEDKAIESFEKKGWFG